MKKQILLFVAFNVFITTAFAQTTVQDLLTENKTNPIGIDTYIPRFSWQLKNDGRNISQIAYELKLIAPTKTGNWNSGKVSSNQSVHIAYSGPALESNTKYQWQVRVWDQTNKPSNWSTPANFQMGLLKIEDWTAKWIEPGYKENEILRPSPLFRKSFNNSKKIQSATIYITSHGLYEAHINGKRVGDAYLTPGWTAYQKRLQYQAYDVTNLLQTGKNSIAVSLGSGWYRGIIGFANNKNVYGNDIALLLQLQIVYSDGTKEHIVTDASWKSGIGAIRSAEIYNGETIDARQEKAGWKMADYNDEDWSSVIVGKQSMNNLIATENELVKKHEVFHPAKIFTTPKGEKVIDFGQNLVGWVTMKVQGNSGDKITISHAEVLDKEGNFYTENLRAAACKNTYILKGGEEEIFEPHFTWQGFRYAKIEGYPGDLNSENFSAVALYSDMPQTGSFNTSNDLINQLQHNIQWGQNGNFLDVPTDCPQRDERLGWTGDAQAFSRTASFNRNVNSFFSKWMKDVAADQLPNGSVPFVIPNILGANSAGATGWADVATIIPWNMYLAYGDKRILEQQYASMKSWLGYMQAESKNDLWNTGFHFGDWLFYRPFDDNDGKSAVTDKYLIAQCFFAHSAQILINTAKVLGKNDDIAVFEAILKKTKDAFLKEYVTGSGRLVSSTQTAYVLALEFDMLPESMRAQAAERLVANIKSYRNHLTTGFLGTPYLCEVLSRFGYVDMAYTLLLQETYPSWLYPVKMGATTIWERWNGIRTDGSFEPASMNSFNHYAYGAIGDWMYREMVGIDTYEDGVGYQHIKIEPHIGGTFTNASASLKTYYGTVSSGWELSTDSVQIVAVIPPNTHATIIVPARSRNEITENGKALSDDIKTNPSDNFKTSVRIEVGSGKYHFEVKRK
jgi:alpha-L-rhamnosidase